MFALLIPSIIRGFNGETERKIVSVSTPGRINVERGAKLRGIKGCRCWVLLYVRGKDYAAMNGLGASRGFSRAVEAFYLAWVRAHWIVCALALFVNTISRKFLNRELLYLIINHFFML